MRLGNKSGCARPPNTECERQERDWKILTHLSRLSLIFLLVFVLVFVLIWGVTPSVLAARPGVSLPASVKPVLDQPGDQLPAELRNPTDAKWAAWSAGAGQSHSSASSSRRPGLHGEPSIVRDFLHQAAADQGSD